MAAVGAGLRAYTKFGSVEYANGEAMPAEQYLREVEGVVLDVMLDEIFRLAWLGRRVSRFSHALLCPLEIYLPRIKHRGGRRLRFLLSPGDRNRRPIWAFRTRSTNGREDR